MLQSMRDLERTWNHKFNYPWTFFNDKPFTEEFKKKTRAATKAEVRYGAHGYDQCWGTTADSLLLQSSYPPNTGTSPRGSTKTSIKNPYLS